MKVGTDGVLLGAWALGGSRVLDIGTGTGLVALMMAQRFPQSVVDAIDIDEEACRQAADWFAPGWRLYNECTILTRDPNDPNKMKEYRPDRVMERNGRFVVVDFKFAAPNDEHKRQVATYMALLRQMGNSNVKGYLWYVYSNKIVEIEAETI